MKVSREHKKQLAAFTEVINRKRLPFLYILIMAISQLTTSCDNREPESRVKPIPISETLPSNASMTSRLRLPYSTTAPPGCVPAMIYTGYELRGNTYVPYFGYGSFYFKMYRQGDVGGLLPVVSSSNEKVLIDILNAPESTGYFYVKTVGKRQRCNDGKCIALPPLPPNTNSPKIDGR